MTEAHRTTTVGIDVGGTKTAIGLVGFPTGEVLLETEIPTIPGRASEQVLDDIVQAAEQIATGAKKQEISISGVGLGVCELVGKDGQLLSRNLLNWERSQLQKRLGHLGPLVVEADVRAAARAEALFGAGRPYRIFLFVTVGTGIACCLVSDGVPYLGARGATGTMASSPMDWTCEACGQTDPRSLEDIASGPALVRRFNLALPGNASTGQEVFEAASAGNKSAEQVIRSAGLVLGTTVSLMINVLDPEAVVVGGGLGLGQGLFWESFVDSTRRHVWAEVHRQLPIHRAGTGRRAGMIGAAIAAWKEGRDCRRS